MSRSKDVQFLTCGKPETKLDSIAGSAVSRGSEVAHPGQLWGAFGTGQFQKREVLPKGDDDWAETRKIDISSVRVINLL